MKYGRHQIDKAGEIAISSREDDIVKNAIAKINDWRSLHLFVLDKLQTGINEIINNNRINATFTSRRLKRLTSIIYKLDLNPQMKLGGMQDIGGLRVVLPNIKTLDKLYTILQANVPEGFMLEKSPINYIEFPKESGYRSVHFVYKFVSDNNDYNGLRVELQVRTKLQHFWAMAVETAGLVTKTPLKSSQGADEWLEFFKYVSSLFAIKEERNILPVHSNQGLTTRDLMKLLYVLDKKYNLCDTLKALRVTNNFAIKENYTNKYYILNINFKTKRVNVNPYNDETSAMNDYSRLERVSQDAKNAVVLVSVSKIKELQEAYPSYFLDTSDFLRILDRIISNCEKMKLV
ncbi:MAG: RelA/SpoT domain-containing protein [Bacteroides sp.]|nr:RelA/SpoT domain-containing protein [Bacteroides sp.]